jgi:hypothetical protein
MFWLRLVFGGTVAPFHGGATQACSTGPAGQMHVAKAGPGEIFGASAGGFGNELNRLTHYCAVH